VLRIGIEKLLDEKEQIDYKKIKCDEILGQTDNQGHWLDMTDNTESQPDVTTQSNEDHMYMFEGVDYRSMAQQKDVTLFDHLIQSHLDQSPETKLTKQRPSARKPMSEEERAARAAKARETKARRQEELVC
jgi:uncharacterized cysteine cluster protein YcgN (CxxCxxCC family)